MLAFYTYLTLINAIIAPFWACIYIKKLLLFLSHPFCKQKHNNSSFGWEFISLAHTLMQCMLHLPIFISYTQANCAAPTSTIEAKKTRKIFRKKKKEYKAMVLEKVYRTKLKHTFYRSYRGVNFMNYTKKHESYSNIEI